MTVIIPRNSVLPLKKSQVFTTYADNQTSIIVRVFAGERAMTKDNLLVAAYNISGIEPKPRGVPQITITFDVGINSVLSVRATAN